MTIEVYQIEGARSGRRLNEAFSVVAQGDDGRFTDLVDIIPKADIPGRTGDDVEAAYNKAFSGTTSREAAKTEARALLGLNR